MEPNKIDTSRLLKAIRNTNAHFHLHKENEIGFKGVFYKVKNSIVKEFLKRNVDFGINYYIIESSIDKFGNTYTLVEFTNGEINIKVHVPIKLCPHILGISTGEFETYTKNNTEYKEFDISEDEFNTEFKYMQDTFKYMIYLKSVKNMTDIEILNNINSSTKLAGVRASFNNDTSEIIFKTRKKGRLLYKVDIKHIRKAINETTTFRYWEIYHYLVDNGYIDCIRF